MFKGTLPIQLQFFYSHNNVIKKNIFRNQNRNEKSYDDFQTSLFREMFPIYRSIALRGRHSGRGGGFTDTPRSVIPVDWCIFAEDFMKKSRAKITRYPKKKRNY